MELSVSEPLTAPKRSLFNPELHRLNDLIMFWSKASLNTVLHKWQRIQPMAITLPQQFYPCSTTLVAYKMNQSSCCALLCLTWCDLSSQEGYLRRHESAVWDARLVSPFRHVPAASLLQYQRRLRATGRFHHRPWAWTQVRLYEMVSLVPGYIFIFHPSFGKVTDYEWKIGKNTENFIVCTIYKLCTAMKWWHSWVQNRHISPPQKHIYELLWL